MLRLAPAAGDPRTGPRPKPGLTLDDIVADSRSSSERDRDDRGLPTRSVSERLGRTDTTPCTYTPSKSELVDLAHHRMQEHSREMRGRSDRPGDQLKKEPIVSMPSTESTASPQNTTAR
jgi:hypothetical protein